MRLVPVNDVLYRSNFSESTRFSDHNTKKILRRIAIGEKLSGALNSYSCKVKKITLLDALKKLTQITRSDINQFIKQLEIATRQCPNEDEKNKLILKIKNPVTLINFYNYL